MYLPKYDEISNLKNLKTNVLKTNLDQIVIRISKRGEP